jgi:hypothetical protein
MPTARLKSPFLAYFQDFLVDAHPETALTATTHNKAMSAIRDVRAEILAIIELLGRGGVAGLTKTGLTKNRESQC